MTTVSFRLPVDVVDELKEIAAAKGFSTVEALMRFYIGQAVRRDVSELSGTGGGVNIAPFGGITLGGYEETKDDEEGK